MPRFRRRKTRPRRRNKNRKKLLSVKAVEKISKRTAQRVVSKEVEALNLYQPFYDGQAFPLYNQSMFGGTVLLHRGGATDNNANPMMHWGPQIRLQDQYTNINAQGNGYMIGNEVKLLGLKVKGWLAIEPASLLCSPVVQFFCLSHAVLPPGAALLQDTLEEIIFDRCDFQLQQKDSDIGKTYRVEYKKEWKFTKGITAQKTIIPIDFYIKINKTFRYDKDRVVDDPVTQSDLFSRPLFMKWRALNVREKGTPMTAAEYPQLNVSYRWFYTDA